MGGICHICGQEGLHHSKTTCNDCRPAYIDARYKAMGILAKALKDGELARPETCELCGRTPDLIEDYRRVKRTAINGHHWNGHDKPLSVWWICNHCNRILAGPNFHNGTVTKTQARAIVLSRYKSLGLSVQIIGHRY